MDSTLSSRFGEDAGPEFVNRVSGISGVRAPIAGRRTDLKGKVPEADVPKSADDAPCCRRSGGSEILPSTAGEKQRITGLPEVYESVTSLRVESGGGKSAHFNAGESIGTTGLLEVLESVFSMYRAGCSSIEDSVADSGEANSPTFCLSSTSDDAGAIAISQPELKVDPMLALLKGKSTVVTSVLLTSTGSLGS